MIKFNSLPIDGPLRITSKFGPRNTGIKGASTNHKGIDLGRDKSKAQTNILSVAAGTVINNYWNKYRGWVVVIQHNGFQTLYQHLKAKSSAAVGTKVNAGAVLGVMGNSSDTSVLSASVHLHFELIVNGKRIDPQPYLENIQPERSYVKEATELANKIASVVTVYDKDSLITALNDVYNGSIWWVIQKLIDCDFADKTAVDGKGDIFRRSLAAVPIYDKAAFHKELLATGKNSLYWVMKKLLDRLGIE